jgi:hypothetical protein
LWIKNGFLRRSGIILWYFLDNFTAQSFINRQHHDENPISFRHHPLIFFIYHDQLHQANRKKTGWGVEGGGCAIQNIHTHGPIHAAIFGRKPEIH